MASQPDLQPRPITVAEYHRMIEAGILDEDERVELLEGVIVSVSPQKRPHAYAIQQLLECVRGLMGPHYKVLVQLPLTLGERSEPEPDLAVVAAVDAASRSEHPHTALLVVEVAGDSLRKDRTVKEALYGRHAIPEYWIVNLADECVEVHRDPDTSNARYRTVLTFGRSQEVRSAAVSEAVIQIDSLFS